MQAVTFRNKYDERTERMSLRIPGPLKNHIWKTARSNGMTATDVIITILEERFAGKRPAPKWQPGTTKKTKDRVDEKDVFA